MEKVMIKMAKYPEEFSLIKAIRKQVFQEEQKVPFELEFDGKDDQSIHLLAYVEKQPIATTRIREISPHQIKIERLAVLPQFRRKGIGNQLMIKALELIEDNDYQEIVIHAQEYIKQLYQKLGFIQIGNSFIEAGITHVKMAKKIK